MFPRRRTLSFVLTLLSLSGDLIFVASLGTGPTINVQPVLEYYPSLESPTAALVNPILTAPANGMLTEFSPVLQRTFPGSQRLMSNEALSYGSYTQGLPFNNGFPLNYAVPNTNSLTTYSTSSSYLTPVEVSNSLQLVQPTTDVLTEVSITPSQIESLAVVEQNYSPVPQTVQVEAFAPIAEVAEVYQTPINVQIPSMPQLSPFIAVATPLPEILPSQSIAQEIYTPKVLPEIYQQPVDIGIGAVASVPVEATAISVPSNDCGCYGQQLPFTLQINMAPPSVPEPVINVISPQPQPISSASSQYDSSSFGMSPYPVVVMESSRSKWKSILPILLLTLFDGSSGNSGGGGSCCSQCSTSIPIPFPIPIPINNPIITGSSRRSRGKEKAKRSIELSINNQRVI